jgi:dTDP-4-amino-4,6-dideoxygalactose transaminase
MKVPFLDLLPQYQEIKEVYDPKYREIMATSAFVGSSFTKAFEDEFASYIGTKYCIAVNSGTAALHVALLAAGIGPGDEVITSAHSFFASAAAIIYTGAKPVLVDIDPQTKNINPKLIPAAITSKTKAILPVHIYGYTAKMDEIADIAKKHKLLVIEDACQAHGSLFKGRYAGSLGLVSAFSFYPGKNLGTNGEGGAVTTDNEKIAEKAMLLREHGALHKYHHQIVGFNYRLNNIQSSFLSAKLPKLDEWNAKRRQVAKIYFEIINPDLTTKYERLEEHNFHVFSINVPQRDLFQARLTELGVGTNIHYPIPIHQQKAFTDLYGKSGPFPETEKQAETCLSLPMYPHLTEEQARFVAEAVNQIYEGVK